MPSTTLLRDTDVRSTASQAVAPAPQAEDARADLARFLAPPRFEAKEGSLREGRVLGADGDRLLVSTDMGTVPARRAAGCLLAPEAGDTVLVYAADGGSYVLSVLVKAEEAGTLTLPRETALRADHLHIDAAETCTVVAGDMETRARSFSVRASLLSFSGRLLRSTFERVHNRFGRLADMVRRRFGVYGRVVDRVEDVLDTEAGRVRLTAQDGLRLRARTADLRAKDSVTVDGDSIHIG